MISQLWTILAFVAVFGTSKQVTNVFDLLRDFETKQTNDPERRVTFHWRIAGWRVKRGDEFELSTPCIRLAKPFEIRNRDTVLAKCAYENGGTSASAKIKCVATDQVNHWTNADGCVKIVVVMGEVRSSSAFDLSFGSCFRPGKNELKFRHGNKEFKTEAILDRTEVVKEGDRIVNRWPFNAFYYKPSGCRYGYESLEVTLSSNMGIDCNSVTSFFANTQDFNAFGQPKRLTVAKDAKRNCNLNSATIKLGKLGRWSQPVVFWNEKLGMRASKITIKERRQCINEKVQEQTIDEQLLLMGYINWDPSQNCPVGIRPLAA